jgi:hypothetical protein
VLTVQHDGFQLKAYVVLAIKKPHQHVMGVVVDDEQAIAEGMRGGDINWPQRSEDVLRRGREGFAQAVVLRGAAMALWSKHESQQTFLTELSNAGPVGFAY